MADKITLIVRFKMDESVKPEFIARLQGKIINQPRRCSTLDGNRIEPVTNDFRFGCRPRCGSNGHIPAAPTPAARAPTPSSAAFLLVGTLLWSGLRRRRRADPVQRVSEAPKRAGEVW